MNPTSGEDVIVQRVVLAPDEQSAQRTVQTFQQVRQQSVALVDNLRQVQATDASLELTQQRLNVALETTARNQAFQSLAGDAASAKINVEQLVQQMAALGATDAEVQKVVADIERLQSAGVNGGSGGALASARNIAGAARGVASTVGGGQAVSAISSVLGLTQVLGPFGAAVGVGVVALKAVTDAQNEAAASAKQYAADLTGTAQAVAGGATSPEIDAAIAKLGRQREVQQQAVDSLTLLQDEGRVRLQQFFSGMIDDETFTSLIGNVNERLSDLTGGVITDWSQVDDAIAAANEQITATDASIANYNAQLNTQAVAQNDAAEAAQKLADAQEAAAQKVVEIDSLTREQREQRIAQNDREVDVLTRFIGAGGQSEETVKRLAERITELNKDTEQLRAVSESYADVLDREARAKQAIQDQFDAYGQAIEAEGKIREKIFEIQSDIDQARAEAEDKLSQIAADARDKRIEFETDAAEKREAIVQESADRIAKIERDSGRDTATAVASRDALAFTQAQQRRADQLSDEQKAQQKSLIQQDKASQKQLDALEKSTGKQVAAVVDAEQKKVTVLQGSLYMQQQAQIKAAYDAQQIALYGSNNQQIIHTSLWTNLQQIAIQGVQNVLSAARSLIGGYGGANGYPSSFTSPTPLPPVTGTAATGVSAAVAYAIATTAARDYQASLIQSAYGKFA